jgi:hypothetical protein
MYFAQRIGLSEAYSSCASRVLLISTRMFHSMYTVQQLLYGVHCLFGILHQSSVIHLDAPVDWLAMRDCFRAPVLSLAREMETAWR